MIHQFPCNTPQRVPLTLPQIPGSQPSWRVIFSRERVPLLVPGTNDDGADEEGYFPISAVYLQAAGCKVSRCVDATLFIDDGLSRCALWVNQVALDPAVPVPFSSGLTVDYVIKVAAANLSTPVYHGSFDVEPDALSPQEPRQPRGLLAVVSGPLGTQYEVWARVSPESENPRDVEVRFQMVVDRLGDRFAAYRTVLGGGGDLPPP